MDVADGTAAVGPLVGRLMRTHAWRSFAHLQDVHWTRLAAAMTFTSFLALFPLLTVAAAIGAALLSRASSSTGWSKAHRAGPRHLRPARHQRPGRQRRHHRPDRGRRCCSSPASAGSARCATACARCGARTRATRTWSSASSWTAASCSASACAVLVSLGASGFATAAVNWTADQLGLEHNGRGGCCCTVVGFGSPSSPTS